MADELSPTVIKHTQDTLGKYVKKPSLTDKLLKKPPFRFLHDVFAAIIRDTKCFVGLYTLEELTYENIKDRDDKMKFLQKMIDVVKLTTGSSLAIKTSKIVAGHEPQKTNELLQLMAEIIDNKLDWQNAVEHLLSGKTADKESQRKVKDTVNIATEENKSGAKEKEKVSQAVEPKKSKASSTKISTTTTNKDDKMKRSKTKHDNTSRHLTTKETTLKRNKEPEKSVRKLSNPSSNTKSKLKKNESLSSNKSSPSTKTPESKKELQNIQTKMDCNHEEESEQQSANSKINTTLKNISTTSVKKELSKSDGISNEKQEGATRNLNNLEPEKSKKSSNSRKSSITKPPDSFGEHVDAMKDNRINLEMPKSDVSETAAISAELSTSTTDQEQQQMRKHSESVILSENLQEKLLDMSQNPTKELPQPSPAAILKNNEFKRESTFTRDNSTESNKSSLVNRPRTSLRPPSARPPSARPGAPRRRDKNIEIILQPNEPIKMSNIQVKLETFGAADDDDDAENLVIIENPNVSDAALDHQSNSNGSETVVEGEALEHGHLVQQILETQKELVQQQSDANSQEKNDKDSSNNSVMRQTSARNMNNLRDVIQNITKSVNPLGKLMDFIPEDIDAMQLEFTLWRDTYTQAAIDLKREKSLTESATEPMKNQLVQIEANIVEYMEMINASRVKMLQNSEKLIKMLT